VTGETERSPSGWTPDTLKVLEDEKIGGLERLFVSEIRRLDEALAAQDRAVVLLNTANQIAQDKFEATVQRDSVKQNEFRGALDDLTQEMATRREMETLTVALNGRLDDLTKQIGDLRSRVDIGPATLSTLQSRFDLSSGRQLGVGLAANVLVTVVTVIIAALVLYAALHK
jgi:hypothetical protein